MGVPFLVFLSVIGRNLFEIPWPDSQQMAMGAKRVAVPLDPRSHDHDQRYI